MGMLGKGVGVLAKGIGSGSPSFVLEDRPDADDNSQFKVTASFAEEFWWIGINPGWAYYPNYTVLMTSTGDRDISVGDSSVGSESDFANFRGKYINACHAYSLFRYADIANNLSLGQQYSWGLSTGLVYVVMVQPIPASQPPRLLVISKADFDSYYLFGCTPSNGDLGASAVLVTLSASELSPVTTTISGNTVLTDGTTVLHDAKTYWERLGLACKIIATLDPVTGTVTQVHTGPIYFDQLSEHYTKKVATTADVISPPDVVDGGWSAAYYATGEPSAVPDYIFDYIYPDPS